jgi:Ca2+/Na+ antiporter
MISNLEKTYLGLTIISIGNALPDGITTLALAK